jgi:tight adherence protein B
MKRFFVPLLAAAALAVPAAAAGAGSAQIRHVDFHSFPQVRVTVIAPAGVRPVLLENGRGAAYGNMHQLGSAEALVLAVDKSQSMRGRPLREAKAAAQHFLAGQQRATTTGLVAFGREALALTRPNESVAEVSRALMQLAPDAQTGTALYDAVVSSVARLERMSSGTRILVLLTDGRDVGSNASVSRAISAAQRGGVLIYPIAAGPRADKEILATLASETGGRLFDANDVSQLDAIYAALGRELARTWQISYLSRARPGDTVTFGLRAGGTTTVERVRVPGDGAGGSGPLPSSMATRGATAAAFIVLAAILLAAAGLAILRTRQKSQVARLLQPHFRRSEEKRAREEVAGRMEALTVWTESALDDLPGSTWLANTVERSGVKVRLGHVPYLALLGAFVLGILGTIVGAGPFTAILLMLLGLFSPFVFFRVAGARRRKAFDKQLPDVLATIASTLRAGHGLRIAMRAVADDGSPPASEEFSRVLGEERLGRPLHEAVEAMCQRIGSADLDYVATAINVQSQAGGSLASLFDTLSETVRERQRHTRKVRALTSMGRTSALILVCLPFCLAALMTLISPSYMSPFYTTSTGHFLMGFCLVSMAMGGLLLKRIVNVRY